MAVGVGVLIGGTVGVFNGGIVGVGVFNGGTVGVGGIVGVGVTDGNGVAVGVGVGVGGGEPPLVTRATCRFKPS